MTAMLPDLLQLLIDHLRQGANEVSADRTRDFIACCAVAVKSVEVAWERLQETLAAGVEGDLLVDPVQRLRTTVSFLPPLLTSAQAFATQTLPKEEAEKTIAELKVESDKTAGVLQKLTSLQGLLADPSPQFDESMLFPLDPNRSVSIEEILMRRGLPT